MESSGYAWCRRFPPSARIEDLAEPFRSGVARFLDALRAAGASVVVSATYRPPERAYLMHWASAIAGYRDRNTGPWTQADPSLAQGSVAAMLGIDWTHDGDRAAAREAAREMVDTFGVVFPAALESRHVQRLAIDATISWRGVISIVDARGVAHDCAKQEDLWPIGASFGVHKLPSDPPHWSSDGH